MPTPDRTSLAEIVTAGRTILEAEGLSGLTMQRVAAAVAVRAPSLYKRVRSRDHLVRLIAESATDDLAHVVDAAVAESPDDPRAELHAVARAFRAFALGHPGAYGLIFGALPAASRLPAAHLERASAAVLRTAERLAGPDDALEAARTITAWATGFVGMELAGAFQLGGDVTRAYEFGVEALSDALDVRGRALRG